jgi:hypothetical protein
MSDEPMINRDRLARLLSVVAVAGACGCGGPTADVVVTVANSAGSPTGPPGTVEIHLFDEHGFIGGARVAPVELPGSVRVTDVPASPSSQLRVVAAGYVGVAEALLAAASLTHMTGPTATVALDLSPHFSDGDGDAVPDAIDDCPTVFDPEQERMSGFGAGDACR